MGYDSFLQKSVLLMTTIASYLAVPSTLVASSMIMVPAFALTKSQVDSFANKCSSASYLPDGNFSFAPVERITPEGQIRGQFSYNIRSVTYPDNQVKLEPDRVTVVTLVSTVKRVDYDDSSLHIWHVVAAPRVNGWSFGGHWAISDDHSNSYTHMLKSNWNEMKRLSSHEGDPVYRTINPQFLQDAEKLTEIWKNNFGKDIIGQLVFDASTAIENDNEQKDTYSITFYYVPKPDLRYIQNQGHRWVSSKNVDSPGVVYGFVLDAEGRCVGNTKVEVVSASLGD